MCDQCKRRAPHDGDRPYRRYSTSTLRRVLAGDDLGLDLYEHLVVAELAKRPANAAERELAGRMPNGQEVQW